MKYYLVAILLLALLLASGCPRTGDTDAAVVQNTPQTEPVEVDPPVVMPDQQATPASMPAPEISFTLADGTAKKLSDYRGKPVVLNFWAEW